MLVYSRDCYSVVNKRDVWALNVANVIFLYLLFFFFSMFYTFVQCNLCYLSHLEFVRHSRNWVYASVVFVFVFDMCEATMENN